MARISLCMIAKDEEHFLRQCLESVKDLVDEIIVVVDDRSEDSTLQVAKDYGSKIKTFHWVEDFSAARNASLDMATGDWILVLDADEELTAEGRNVVKQIVEGGEYDDKDIIGFKFDQRTYLLKDRSKYVALRKRFEMDNYKGHKSSQLVRLFKNHPKIRFRHRVHELVEDSIKENNGKIVTSGIVLHHFAALKGMEFYLHKIKQYTEIMVEQLKDDPDNIRYLYQAGNIFFDNQEYPMALKYYMKVADKNPHYRLVWSDIAQCHLRQDNIAEAIKAFNTSLRVKPGESSAANNLAVLYMQYGKVEIAQKLLEKYLSMYPDNEHLKLNYDKLKTRLSQISVTRESEQ